MKARARDVALAVGALMGLVWLLPPLFPLGNRMLAWIPGRTASTMTVFALLAMVCYARFERLSAPSRPIKSVPTALPVTHGTSRNQQLTHKNAMIWLVIALLGLILALGSYEQAVVLPAALLGLAVWFYSQGRRPMWWIHAVFSGRSCWLLGP